MEALGEATARLETVQTGGRNVLRVSGRLDARSTPALWVESRRLLEGGAPPAEVDVAGVATCDSAGAAWLVWLGVPVTGANRQVGALLDLVRPRERHPPPAPHVAARSLPLVTRIGAAAHVWADNARGTVAYVGSLLEGLAVAITRPGTVRRGDLLNFMSRTGSEALPIVALITFLVGVIIAFQASVQLRRVGLDLLVADTVALSVVMELGPLMTAIIMAGRSGSAFAAEIGTMKVNEEVDALETMGLDRTRFLVMPRFVALLVTMPLLVTFANFCGILGGFTIATTLMNIPPAAYVHATLERLTLWHAAQGYIKGETYAVVIAAVGCLRGLQTRVGAQGVGLSATSAVVSGIFLIIVADAILTVLFHVR